MQTKIKTLQLILCLLLLAVCLMCFSGCSGQSGSRQGIKYDADTETVIHLTEDVSDSEFEQIVDAIYADPASFDGKQVEISGIFFTEEATGPTYYYIGRNCAGCEKHLDLEGMSSIETQMPVPLPEYNDWVQATGVIHQWEEKGHTFPLLILEDVVIK